MCSGHEDDEQPCVSANVWRLRRVAATSTVRRSRKPSTWQMASAGSAAKQATGKEDEEADDDNSDDDTDEDGEEVATEVDVDTQGGTYEDDTAAADVVEAE